ARLVWRKRPRVEAASAPLPTHMGGVPAIAEEDKADAIVASSSAAPVPPVVATPIVVTPSDGGITFQRLSQVPPPP
ncbi:MAG TPA: integrase, partial [Cupriavidus sp.]|nr:integrase [Cupriavidus sp.]